VSRSSPPPLDLGGSAYAPLRDAADAMRLALAAGLGVPRYMLPDSTVDSFKAALEGAEMAVFRQAQRCTVRMIDGGRMVVARGAVERFTPDVGVDQFSFRPFSHAGVLTVLVTQAPTITELTDDDRALGMVQADWLEERDDGTPMTLTEAARLLREEFGR
jgi:hypothetical protein